MEVTSETQEKTGPNAYELEMYKVLVSLSNTEETTFYTRNNILVVLQGGLVAAVAGILTSAARLGGEREMEVVLTSLQPALNTLCLVGILSSLGWLFMIRRSSFIADQLMRQIVDTESMFAKKYPSLEKELLTFSHFTKALQYGGRTFLLERLRLSTVWTVIALLFVLVWFIIASRFSASLFSKILA